MKKYLISILFLSLTITTLSATDWNFEKKGDDYFLKSPNGNEARIFVDVGEPKYIKTEDLGSNHLKVIYFSGDVGTSQIIKTYRAAVFKKGSFEFLGDFPHRYEGGSGMTQPEWSIKDGTVTIKDADQDENYTLKL